MSRSKVAISLNESTLARLDKLVEKAAFPSRSQAIQEAVEENWHVWKEAAWPGSVRNLDPAFEKALAEEGLSEDASEWPKY